MMNEIDAFAYLQENPDYRRDWDLAFYQNHTEPTPEQIKHFIESIEGHELARRYNLNFVFYYEQSLKEQMAAIYHSSPGSVPIFSNPRPAVAVMPHNQATFIQPDEPDYEDKIEHYDEARERMEGNMFTRLDIITGYSPNLKDGRYLTLEVDITETDQKIIENIKSILRFYRDRIKVEKQIKQKPFAHDPLLKFRTPDRRVSH